MEVSSNGACTSILGYDPVANFVGRGAIEAAAQGITLAPDEIAMRINTLTIQDGMMTSYAGGHISTEESTAIVQRLAEKLNDDTFTIYPGKAYRHILVVKNYAEVLELGYTPPHDISDKPIDGHTPRDESGGSGADKLLALMAAAHEVLVDDPTNAARITTGKLPITDIWPFWPGAAPSGLVPFEEARGMRGIMNSGVDLLRGLAVLFGLDFQEVPGVTDGLDNDFAAQADYALKALDEDGYDLAVIHVEAPDEMGHQGLTDHKIQAINHIDRDIMTRVMGYAKRNSKENGGPGVRVLAMPDHYTPIATRTHEGDPVPFIVWGDDIESNGANAYSEVEAEGTGLALDPAGYEVMDLLTK
jgi:2,3-bisphosphoglycerate-independent phosphoglycerate mutase